MLRVCFKVCATPLGAIGRRRGGDNALDGSALDGHGRRRSRGDGALDRCTICRRRRGVDDRRDGRRPVRGRRVARAHGRGRLPAPVGRGRLRLGGVVAVRGRPRGVLGLDLFLVLHGGERAADHAAKYDRETDGRPHDESRPLALLVLVAAPAHAVRVRRDDEADLRRFGRVDVNEIQPGPRLAAVVVRGEDLEPVGRLDAAVAGRAALFVGLQVVVAREGAVTGRRVLGARVAGRVDAADARAPALRARERVSARRGPALSEGGGLTGHLLVVVPRNGGSNVGDTIVRVLQDFHDHLRLAPALELDGERLASAARDLEARGDVLLDRNQCRRRCEDSRERERTHRG
mmetsp:Transcript_24222/g.75671  ORF Transcript_24222/g.75671 Transcript_24222/m.75671 type:complete len:347 (-) Transcript_24222:16-1056(-)